MCIYLDVSLYFIQFYFFPFTAIFNELLLSLLLKNFTFCRHLGEKLRTLRDDVSLEEGKFCWEDVCRQNGILLFSLLPYCLFLACWVLYTQLYLRLRGKESSCQKPKWISLPLSWLSQTFTYIYKKWLAQLRSRIKCKFMHLYNDKAY